jgi:protein phosphatase
MRSAWRSDPGPIRENNEDRVLTDEKNGIFLLADGMGGGPGGEVASDLAVTTARDNLLNLLSSRAMEEDIPGLMAEALAASHSAVFKRTIADPSLEGMGTTLDMVVIRRDRLFVCHVGDSRIYLFRGGTLRQITSDDNYAAFLAESEKIPPHFIPSGYRHILTQAVGPLAELIPEIQSLEIQVGDILLMCSDGLNEVLRDNEIEEIINRSRDDLDALAETLINASNNRGATDNVSVALIEPLPFFPLRRLLS